MQLWPQIGSVIRCFCPAHPGLTGIVMLTLSLFASPLSGAERIDDATKYGYSNLYGELTPTQVFTLVEDMDAMIMLYANREATELVRQLPQHVVPVSGYEPEQVFVALNALADRVDALAEAENVDMSVQRVKRERSHAIPAEVFLLAGACLDTMAATLAKSDPDTALGNLYNNIDSTNTKTPSDVYALVALLDRKLGVLLGEPNTQ